MCIITSQSMQKWIDSRTDWGVGGGGGFAQDYQTMLPLSNSLLCLIVFVIVQRCQVGSCIRWSTEWPCGCGVICYGHKVSTCLVTEEATGTHSWYQGNSCHHSTGNSSNLHLYSFLNHILTFHSFCACPRLFLILNMTMIHGVMVPCKLCHCEPR